MRTIFFSLILGISVISRAQIQKPAYLFHADLYNDPYHNGLSSEIGTGYCDSISVDTLNNVLKVTFYSYLGETKRKKAKKYLYSENVYIVSDSTIILSSSKKKHKEKGFGIGNSHYYSIPFYYNEEYMCNQDTIFYYGENSRNLPDSSLVTDSLHYYISICREKTLTDFLCVYNHNYFYPSFYLYQVTKSKKLILTNSYIENEYEGTVPQISLLKVKNNRYTFIVDFQLPGLQHQYCFLIL